MFEQALLTNPGASRRAWTTSLGFAGETALAALIALAPILWPQVMPKPQLLLMLLAPPAPVPPPPNLAIKPHATRAPIEPRLLIWPNTIPTKIARVVEDPPAVSGAIPGAVRASGDPNGWLTSILNADIPVLNPPAIVKPRESQPKAGTPAAEPRRIRTSSLELARLVHRVEPIYPPMAKLAHISGTVELTAVVGTDGRIRELRAASGNPLLIKAALDAVSQWIYAPPILNGERVEVIAPITVNFRLDR